MAAKRLKEQATKFAHEMFHLYGARVVMFGSWPTNDNEMFVST